MTHSLHGSKRGTVELCPMLNLSEQAVHVLDTGTCAVVTLQNTKSDCYALRGRARTDTNEGKEPSNITDRAATSFQMMPV